MLDTMIKLLDGLSSTDDGVQCVLNLYTLNNLVHLITIIYGKEVASKVQDAWRQLEDNSYICDVENLSEYVTGNFESF